MSFTEHEMHGLIAGKCVAGDMKVNEELPAYLVRKIQELESERDMYRNAEISWEKAMMSAIGEDGAGSVTKAISDIKAERDALAAKLSRHSMSAGEADQRLCESRAVRVTLGFGADAEDVAPVDLTDKINALAAENVALKGLVEERCWVYDYDVEGYRDAHDYLPETPATDAYANQLRSEGVEMFENWLRESANIFDANARAEWADKNRVAADKARDFAANLRKENGNG